MGDEAAADLPFFKRKLKERTTKERLTEGSRYISFF
jgi:hypothetical protein